ncbi:hypothetical protein POPTR_016G135900v4 [Populus trichocarpa]|uniref:Uncharacterized protein n=2 Tax=Populus trichocarpa TaxID=3694 RepID=A0ACC0RUP3_POPTR|nr:hypothetical protein POPTR_016G135900v4 [Populus trichocarpa]
MVDIPNEDLPSLATGTLNFSLEWLQSNIFSNIPTAQVKYIAVGNEVFLKDPFYTPYYIKLSSPQAASVLSLSYPPSSTAFDPYLHSVMIPLMKFLHDTGSPFMVNEHISLDYALFRNQNVAQDGGFLYANLLDASVDAFAYAMEREGFQGIKIVVSETGWATGGGEAASVANAMAYNENVVRRVANYVGTPRQPNEEMEVYLFDLFDENEKNGEEFT